MKKNLLIVFILLFGMILNAQPQYSGGSNTPPTTPATIPYSCNFENPTENAEWQLSNDVCTNKWFIGTPSNIQAPISGGCLYISNDNGLSNAYTITTPGVVVATRYIQSNGAYQYTLNFDLFIGGESLYDYIKVFVVDVDTNYTGLNGSTYPYYSVAAFNLNQYMVGNAGVPYFNGYNGSSVIAGSYPRSVTIPSMGPAGTVKKLIILWKNDTSTGTMPPASIDNITITPIWCPAPTALTGTNVTNNSINLSWTEVGVATSWNLEYKLNSESVWTEVIGLSTPNYVLNSLDSDSIYNVRVKSNCGTELSVYSNIYTFTTLTFVPATLPYSQDFENPTENAEWKLINGNQTNKFYIGDATQNPAINNTSGGSNALYISNDNGATWAYSGTGTSTNSWVYAYRDFTVPSGVTELKLDFDWIANGGVAASEFLRVYWMPTSIPVVAGAIPPTINSVNYDLTAMIGNYTNGYGSHWLSRQTSWQHATFSINTTQYPTLAGNTWRLYVHWRNNQTTAVQPPATFDNMTLVVSNCPTPRIDSIKNMTQITADIYFSEFGTTNTWNFQYRILGTNTWTLAQATSNPFTLSGLQPSLTYEVRMQSDCSSEQSSWSPIKKFNTTCGTITQIPWFDYFDNYGTGTTIFPACWTKKSNLTNTPSISATNFSAPASMYFYCGSSGNYAIASTPMIDVSYPINTLMLKFRTYFSGNDDTLYVGTMTNPLDETTFTQIAKFSSTTTATWINQALYLNTYQGSDQYISLRTRYGATSSTIYVDNFEILPMPTCLIPNTLSASNLTASEATVSWLPGAQNQTTWYLYYKPTSSTVWDSVQVFATTHTLTNLTDNTPYQYYLRTDCGSELSDATNIATFRTTCAPSITIPYVENFDNYGTGTTIFPACWTKKSNLTNTPSLSTTNFSSPASMYFYCGSSGNYAIASTPMIDAAYPINTLMLNFRSYFSGNDDTLYVGTMTNPLFDTTFTQIAKFSTTTTATWINQVLYLNNYQGTDQYISLRTKFGATSSTIYVDNFRVLPMPTCLIPHSFFVNGITSTDVTINWSASDPSQTTWYIYYKPTASTVWDSVQVYTTMHTLTNLVPNTPYQYYLKTDCGSELSDATNIATFRTACTPFTTLPFVENFDSYGTGSTIFPSCWNFLTTYSSAPYIISGTNFSSPGSIYAYLSSGQYTILIAPTTDASINVSDLQVKFYARGVVGQNVQVGIIEDITNQATFVPIQTIPITGAFVQYTAFLSNYTGTGNRIAFKFAPTAAGANYLDNVEIDLAPTCLPVSNLTVSSIAGSSAYVTWSPNGTPDNFTVSVSPVGQGAWTNYITTNSNYVLTGLNQQTAYTVRVYPTCLGFDGPADTMNFITTCAVGGDLIIGTPTASTSTNGGYFPSQTYYDYSYTQQLFDVTEIVADTIFGIGFQYFFATPESRNVTIYLGHTTQSAFTGVANFIPLDSMMIVYQGPVPFTNAGEQNWVNINFTTPFDYDNVRNLVIAVRDMTGTYTNSGDKFRTHSVTGNKAIYFYQDDTSINPASPTALYTGVSTFRNNIKFILPCMPATCIQPNVILSSIGIYNADMIIVPGASETSWEAEYKKITDTTWTSLGTVSSTTYSLPGLSSNTTYQVRFRTVCSVSDMSLWKTVSFTTGCGPILQVPFVENFDTYGQGTNIYPTCWTRNSTYGANPNISTTNPVSAPHSMYFYSTGTTYSMIVLPPLDQTLSLNSLQLSFSGRISTAGNNLKVGVMTNPNDASTFVLVGTVAPGLLNTYEELTVSFANYLDTGRYIAIRSDNIAQAITNTIYIDNLKLDYIPNCVKPTNVLFTNIMPTSATGFWTPSPSAVSYEVVYGLTGVDPATASPISVNDTFIDMTTLTANTLYHFYVRSVCAGGEFSDWTFLRTFRTACDVISTIPYTENFDSYGTVTGTFPTCWFRPVLNTTTPWPSIVTGSTYVVSSPASLKFQSAAADQPTYAITPQFDIDINTLRVTFKLKAESITSSGTMQVGVMSDPNNLSTFELVETITPTSINFTTYEVMFTNTLLSGTGKYIAFRHITVLSNWYYWLDDVVVDLAPTCLKPTQIVASNITTSSANITWTPGYSSDNAWWIYYKTSAATVYDSVYVTTNPYVLPGLTPATTYQLYMKTDCGTQLSDPSNTISFTTACLPITSVPYTEYFDTYTTGTSAYPTCWSKLTSNATYPYISSTNFSGPGSLYLYSSASGGYCHAISPMFNGTIPINTLKAEFKLRVSATDDTLYVGVMTDPTDQSTFVLVQKLIPSAITTWQNMEVFFNNYTGTGQYIAFKNVYTTTTTTIYVDNLEIFTIPTCPRPTNLIANNSTSSSTTLSWTPGGTETSWNIEYGPIGFTPGSGTSIQASSNPFTLNGLTHSTCYDFYVQAVCSPTDLSMWSNKGTFCTAQITANVPFNIDFETASGVQIANNATGNRWFIGTDTANTVNNTLGGQNALYVSNDNGSTNAFTITTAAVVWAYRDVYFTPSTADYTFSFNWKGNGEGTTIAYDYLSVYMGTPNIPIPSTTTTITAPVGSDTIVTKLRLQPTWQTATFTMPTASYSGQIKRIYFMWRNDGSGGTQPPAAVDNISITSTGISTCLPPTNLTSSSITPTSAQISWTAGGTETAWELDYKLASASTWTTVPVATNATHLLNTLLPVSTYEVRVRAVCGASEFSGYTPIHTFTTTNTPCDVPTNLQVTNITDQSALATWNAGTAISWQVEYKLVSSANWTSASTTTPSFQISGLQSSSNYEIRVKAICSSNESAFTTNVPFTTTGGTVTYTITATAGANGTITPSGVVTVNQGASQTFNFTPSTGYIVSVVTVDGSPITGAPTSYTFTNVSANRTIHVDFISGISENELEQLVELFPNPTTSTIELRLKSEDLHVKECKIYDMYGKLMKTIQINAETITIDVTDFASGVYFVRMDSEIGTISKKFVKK